MAASDALNEQQFVRPSPRMKKFIRQVRTQARGNTWYGEGGGQCGSVSDAVERHFGIPEVNGSFTSDLGEHGHYFNRLSSGHVLDATADQFEDLGADRRSIRQGRGLRIVRPQDPDYKRYVS